MKIVHIVTGLSNGGAEAVLYRLCKHDRESRHHVISLSGAGKYGPMLEVLGVTVTTLKVSRWWNLPMAFIRLVKLLRREKPDVVQTWMYHADFFGGLASRAAGVRSLVWGIRHSTLVRGESKEATIWIANVLAKLSWWLPAKIVVCAKAAMDVHEGLGYDRKKMRLIPNGFDLADFYPRRGAQDSPKAHFTAETFLPLIGTVARFDPQKDHANLLDALAILQGCGLAFRLILVGAGLEASNQKIVEAISQRGLTGCVGLLGPRDDIVDIMNALDLHVLPSAYGEAFPNVVCEAMACGTPCVVTDVGDAAYIVGETGWVVPPREADSLAAAIAAAIDEMAYSVNGVGGALGARGRIEEHFSIERMVSGYHTVWEEVISK